MCKNRGSRGCLCPIPLRLHARSPRQRTLVEVRQLRRTHSSDDATTSSGDSQPRGLPLPLPLLLSPVPRARNAARAPAYESNRMRSVVGSALSHEHCCIRIHNASCDKLQMAGGSWDNEYSSTRHLEFVDRKSTRLNSSHSDRSRMPSSA